MKYTTLRRLLLCSIAAWVAAFPESFLAAAQGPNPNGLYISGNVGRYYGGKMKTQSKPISIPPELAARCAGPDQAERMDKLFRAVLTAPH